MNDNVTGATVLDGLDVTAGLVSGSGTDENGGGLYWDETGSGNKCSLTRRQVGFTGNASFATDEQGVVMGRQVRTVEVPTEAGRHAQPLNVSGVPSEVYFLRLRAGELVKPRKLIGVK